MTALAQAERILQAYQEGADRDVAAFWLLGPWVVAFGLLCLAWDALRR